VVRQVFSPTALGRLPVRVLRHRQTYSKSQDEAAGDGIDHVRKDDRDRPCFLLEGSGRRVTCPPQVSKCLSEKILNRVNWL
jgi:hypothetical protein